MPLSFSPPRSGGASSAVDVALHSKVRNHEAALVATRRALDLAYRHKHRFHVLHVSTGAETELLADHRGLITGEACPHHLLFNTSDYARLGTLVQMNPSIKSAADNELLWVALLDQRLQVIATDHAPHTLAEKRQPYPASPSGVPAVENSLALMLNEVNKGRCTLRHIVDWMCDVPARVWDIMSKGRIEVGYDADFVLVDLDALPKSATRTRSPNAAGARWHGARITGCPVRTWVMGREVYRDGKFQDQVRGHEYWTMPAAASGPPSKESLNRAQIEAIYCLFLFVTFCAFSWQSTCVLFLR